VKIKAMEILDRLVTYAYITHPELMALFICKMVRWTVKYGIDKCSGVAFATFGGAVSIGFFDDHKRGYDFGQLSNTIVERLQARDMEAQTNCVIQLVISHWVEPFHVISKLTLRVYQVWMETGDVYSAFLGSMTYLWICLFSGRKLSLIEADAMGYRYCHHLEYYEHEYF
jgi:predicted ATPase